MLARVVQAAEAAGRDRADLTYALNLQVRLADRPGEDPGVLAGPADHVVERLLQFVDAGFDAFNFIPSAGDMDCRLQVDRLGAEIIPAVRAAVRGGNPVAADRT
jgi:alkanesulfonate monooxygenase SsuD/methylene tetrahydromethanopterin reductase-like flavin-dependent oxidoreductase (luciferase family)